MEDLTGKVSAPGGPETQVTSVEWNNFIQEFKNLIEQLVGPMSVGSLNQVKTALAVVATRGSWFIGSGTAQVHVLSRVGAMPVPLIYAQGMLVRFRPSNNNTGAAPTINVNGLGATAVIRENANALIANDLSTARDATLRYDGLSFRLSEASLGAPSQALPNRWITGLTMGRSAADLIHDIVVQPGECRDDANTKNLVLGTAITKKFDASVGEGTNTGGYPLTTLGVRLANTFYRFFLVRNSDGAIDAGWDSNEDASALLTDLNTIRSGWVEFRQIGWSRTTSVATDLHKLANNEAEPDRWNYVDTDTYNVKPEVVTGIVRNTVTLGFVPPEAVAELAVHMHNNGSGNNQFTGLITDTLQTTDLPSSPSVSTIDTDIRSGGRKTVHLHIRVSGTSQFHHRWNNSASNHRASFSTPAFIWKR